MRVNFQCRTGAIYPSKKRSIITLLHPVSRVINILFLSYRISAVNNMNTSIQCKTEHDHAITPPINVLCVIQRFSFLHILDQNS